MGWEVGTNSEGRDVGYGVPAICDHPDCNKKIDRGIAYICGAEPDGGEDGCGLFFCEEHQVGYSQKCVCCTNRRRKPFTPKPDTPEWMRWKLEDESWEAWRQANPDAVLALLTALRPYVWRVALFWSSSNPTRKVRMIANGHNEIEEWQQRSDFIQWETTTQPKEEL